ncbi:hepatic and glial cell adhesion molecule-like [Scyliorhinus torazame]|uniref:hepatic and glial cell adhesion molecule-like n=1 Tax=Scyliorhinus torazame TaxID=75743 RepID=UPI003B5CE9E9
MKNLGLLNVKMLTLLSVFHLLTLCETEISAVPNTIINVAVGEQVLFPVHNQCGATYEVTLLSKSPTHSKLASWNFNTSYNQPLYENRLKRSRNGSVMLHNVQINDTKLYEIQIDCYSTMTATREQSFDLRVFEPVSKPLMIITCSTSNITMSCTVSMGTKVTYHWEKQSLAGAIIRTYNGTELVIDHIHEQEQYMYKCIATNPVSMATSTPRIGEECNVNPSKGQKLSWMARNIAASGLLLALITIVYICYKIKPTAGEKGSNESGKRHSSPRTVPTSLFSVNSSGCILTAL